MSFFELHTRSAFSFLSSGSLPEDIAVRAAELDMPAIGMMDRDTVSGAVRFHLEAKEQGVRAMVGSEITMDDGSLLPLDADRSRGYQNMSRLITTVKLRHKKGEHFATRKDIEEHASGLLCFTGGADGFIHRSIKNRRGQEDLAWLKYTFGDRLYVELQRHHLPHEEDINQSLLGLAHKFRIPYFASNGPYYADKRDRELFDVFTCIKNHCTIENAGRLISENSERYLKSAAQMLYQFDDYQQAVATTAEIADRVKFSMDELGYTFPDYPVPPGETMDSFLRKQAEKGAVWRYWSLTPKVRQKLDYELNMIAKLKLAGYFLLVWDISQFCRAQEDTLAGTRVGGKFGRLLRARHHGRRPDRGTICCSNVFSPKSDRISRYRHRSAVGRRPRKGHPARLQKIRRTRCRHDGECHQLSRAKSPHAKSAKVFGFNEECFGRLAKIIPHYGTHTRAEMMARFIEAGFDPKENYRIAKYMEMYARVLDYPRHLGQHSGGMVISLGRLDGVVPLEPASMENRNIIQWDKDDCERLGIVKVDLLGLGMMAVIRDTLYLDRRAPRRKGRSRQDIEKRSARLQNAAGGRHDRDVSGREPCPDQFSAEIAARKFLRHRRPGRDHSSRADRRQDAQRLHRPPYGQRRGRLHAPVVRADPQTHARRSAVSGAIAANGDDRSPDLRAVRPRNCVVLSASNVPTNASQRSKNASASGMADKNITQEIQDQIVKSILAFANYGFPESHAASFALLTYASAYLKVHYLAEFTTAMLNNYPLGFYSPATLIKDAQRHGLHFNAININQSQRLFTIEDGKVRIGLKYVKGLRKDVADEIVTGRNAGCQPATLPYTSVEDLVKRVPAINKKEIRALSLSGALNFESTVHRRQALWESELAIQPAGELFANIEEKQETPPFINQMSKWQLMETDLMTTGITIGKHPMAFLREELTKHGVIAAYQTTHLKKRDVVTVAGAVIVRQRPSTAKDVVFITMEDETGYSNFIVMPDIFERFRRLSYRAILCSSAERPRRAA